MTEKTKAFDEQYYAQTADRHGWGGDSAVLDPERSRYLKAESRGITVLDVGCATGIYVDLLAKAGFEAHGVDFTKQFIDIAKKRYKGDFKVGNAFKLPYKDKSMDTVLLLDILEHLDDVRALKEAARVAKRRIVVVIPNVVVPELEQSGAIFRDYLDTSHLRYYSREMVEELAGKVGGKITVLRGVAPFDFDGFLRRTIAFPSRFFTRVFFKLFFTSIKSARVKTYYSEWLLVIDL